MRRLRVLITNNTLAERAGSEIYVRDLALGLLARGHYPVAYSTRLGEVAAELHRATVPVIQDLDQLSDPPDLIHGHHHVETITALLRFPDTPGLFVCHGWIPWEEMPLRFPRIHKYVAVDHTCRDRLLLEGIPRKKIRVILNAVDLERFLPRPQLPEKPRRALVFSNYATESNYLPTIREACGRLGIELDAVGSGLGKPCSHPEALLPQYDLVFAKGRAALEALAVGNAVVLCDAAGSGPMVTAATLDRLRLLNFGIRALSRPISVETLVGEIKRYDSRDAASVNRFIRRKAGRDAALDKLLAVYDDVLTTAATGGLKFDRYKEGRAAAAYLRVVSPVFQSVSQQSPRREAESLRAECAWLRAEDARQRSQQEQLRNECQELRAERENQRAEAEQMRKALTENRQAANLAHSCCEELTAQCQRLGAEVSEMSRSLPIRLRSVALSIPILGRLSQLLLRGARRCWRAAKRRTALAVAGPDQRVDSSPQPASGWPIIQRRSVCHAPMPIIVGVARSGTTLLRLMLDAHPQVAIPAETGFVVAMANLTGSGADLRQTFRDTLAQTPTWPDMALSLDDLWPDLLRVEPFTVEAGLRCFYQAYARRQGKPRWGDKTPTYGQRLLSVEKFLPDAHFIHVIRDGRDVALSLRGLWFGPGDSIEALARHWREQIAVTRQQAAGCRHYLEVRYEELVTDTSRVLRQICEFLALPYSPEMEQYHRGAKERLNEVKTRYKEDGTVLIGKDQRLGLHRLTQHAPDASRIGKWKTQMTATEQSLFEQVAGSMLKELGYAGSPGSQRLQMLSWLQQPT